MTDPSESGEDAGSPDENPGCFDTRTENNHAHARANKGFREKHGDPDRPFYTICTECEERNEHDEPLIAVLHDAKRHAGWHGMDHEPAEIIITDAYGTEVFRQHALFKPEHEPEECPTCGVPFNPDSDITCPGCGRVGDRHIDGGEAGVE